MSSSKLKSQAGSPESATKLKGKIEYTDDIDPQFNLPYVAIPDERDVFGDEITTLRGAVLFYFSLHKLLVGRLQKELYVMVSGDSILTAKKQKGQIARHIPFSKICEIVTNVDQENAENLRNNPSYAPFLLFSLVATEPADLILLSDNSKELGTLFSMLIRIWANNRDYPHIRIKTVDAPTLALSNIDHRIPKSSRNEHPQKPTLQLLTTKQQQRMAFNELSKNDSPAIEAFVAQKAQEVAERKKLIETSKKLYEAKMREDKANLRLQEEEEKLRQKELGRLGSPPLSARSHQSDGFSDDDFKEVTTEGSLAASPSLVESPSTVLQKRRPRSHTLGINEVLKPFLKGNTGENDVISYMSGGLFSPDTAARFELPVKLGPSRLSYAVSYTGVESKDPRTGIPYATVPKKVGKKFPTIAKGSNELALLFFDTVLVNFNSNSLVESNIYFCPERLYVADSEDKVRVCVEINDISNLISVDSILEMQRSEQVSEAVVMMLREGMADVLIGFKFPGRREAFTEYLKRACASSNEPTLLHLDSCKSLPETGCDISGYEEQFATDVPPPSKKERGEILSPAQIADTVFPTGEFKVTADMKKDAPKLVKGWVQWAGYVRQYEDPYPSKKKGRNPDKNYNSLVYVSSTHIYLVRETKIKRCIDTKLLKRIDVQSLLNKHTTDARKQRLILVCEEPEFDLCIEHDWEEDAQRFISAVLQAARKTKGTGDNLPPLQQYNDVEKNKYRFAGDYRPSPPELPMSQEFMQELGHFRNKIARYFVRNDPERVKDSLQFAKQHHENPDPFLESLVQRYGVPLERNINILDYRGRIGRFFGKYAPELIPRAPMMLEKAKGAEEEMIHRLVLKYGPEPEIPSDDGIDDDNMTRALKKIFTTHDPPRVVEAKTLREKNYGTEKELMELLRTQYNAPAGDPLFEVPELLSQEQLLGRPRLRRFCLRYMPDRTDDTSLTAMLLAHRGTIDELMSNLVGKYGPEPPSEISRRSRERLRRFLTKYEPAHPTDDASLDDYIASFPGSEHELYAKLVKKYGPEPVPEGADPLTNVYDTVDLSKELPYAVVPDAIGDRFRTLIERPMAIYWFGLVSHWEPPSPATLRYGYVTSTHYYVADSETSVRRCIPLKSLRAIYINTKRDLSEERQCSVLFQVASGIDHDLFLTFASDTEAKHMLWIIAEIVAKQNWDGPGLRILGLKDFEEVDSQVTPSPTFKLNVAPLPHQKLADHPEHTLREHIANAKLGEQLLSGKLWHTEARGPNLKGLTGLEYKNTLNYLELRKSKFGAGQPNFKMMRPADESKWRPADDIQLDSDVRQPLKGSNAAAMFEQVRAVNKYSRDGKFGNSLPAIERDPSINREYISPSRRADLAITKDLEESDEDGIADFEFQEEDKDDDFDSDGSDEPNNNFSEKVPMVFSMPEKGPLSDKERNEMILAAHKKRQVTFANRNHDASAAMNALAHRTIATPSAPSSDLFDLL